MTSNRNTGSTRRLAFRLATLAGLLLAGLSLGGCIIVTPSHHYYRGYY